MLVWFLSQCKRCPLVMLELFSPLGYRTHHGKCRTVKSDFVALVVGFVPAEVVVEHLFDWLGSTV